MNRERIVLTLTGLIIFGSILAFVISLSKETSKVEYDLDKRHTLSEVAYENTDMDAMFEEERSDGSNVLSQKEVVPTLQNPITNDSNEMEVTLQKKDQTDRENYIVEEIVEDINVKKHVTYTGNADIDTIINEHEEEIADADLQMGIEIRNKIDESSVRSYLQEGLTDEERSALSNYLNSVLSPTEYKEIKRLFAKYNYFLN